MPSTWVSNTRSSTWLAVALAGALTGILAACHGGDQPSSSSAPSPGPATTSTAASPPSTNPLLAADSTERGQRLHGQIIEKLPAGGYTYLELELADGDRTWVVLMSRETPGPGDEIDVVVMGSRDGFHSRRLDRRFDRLLFASLGAQSGARPGDATTDS